MKLWFKKSLSFVLAILGIISVLQSELSAQDWIISTLGSDIDGEASRDDSGTSVSLSSDGTVVAIGAPDNNAGGAKSGHVRVYQYDTSQWVQLGTDIDGEASDGKSGTSVSLSSKGKTVAIGAPSNHGAGTGYESGHVRVYQWDFDTDGDGVGDNDDAFPNDPTETVDTDGDGAGNNADTDDDGDGYSDLLESLAGGNRLLSTDHDKTKTFLMGYGLYASKDVNELTAPARLLGKNDVISDPSQYGLFNEGSLEDLRKDALFIIKNSQGDLVFDYQIQASEDLENWIVLENLQYKVTPNSDKEFLRVRVSNE